MFASFNQRSPLWQRSASTVERGFARKAARGSVRVFGSGFGRGSGSNEKPLWSVGVFLSHVFSSHSCFAILRFENRLLFASP